MKKIVECVPNFSEGRDRAVIDQITGAVKAVKGVSLLSVEPDHDYNRTVVTFVGDPDGVVEAAFQATAAAARVIDMRRHKGEHPRLGATDVVPFVPVTGVSMRDCVGLAERFGARAAQELNIPIYLYEEAARIPERKNLATIRKGEYEGLEEKLRDPAWKPDFGEPAHNPASGATVTGAREFLIAYNVNLNTNNKALANEIAVKVRESGRTMKHADGSSVKVPGTLRSVKAMGVILERLNIAQVSMNLTNFHVTPPHVAFEEVKKEADKLGIRVTGSEIVGLIPLEALILAGRFYGGQGSDSDIVHQAATALGLSQIDPFDPHKKIIDYLIS